MNFLNKDGLERTAIDLRLQLAMIAPNEAAALWAVPNVISFMNQYWDEAHCAAANPVHEAGEVVTRWSAVGVGQMAVDASGRWVSERDFEASQARIAEMAASLVAAEGNYIEAMGELVAAKARIAELEAAIDSLPITDQELVRIHNRFTGVNAAAISSATMQRLIAHLMDLRAARKALQHNGRKGE